MLDRALGIIGIALAIIFGFWSLAPEGWPKMPLWALVLGIGIGVLLIGFAAGLITGEYRKTRASKLVDTASLRLHIYPDDRTPQRLSFENIWRWYYLKMIIVEADKTTGKDQRKHVAATLFISFENQVEIGTLEISSPDIRLPLHEVKEFNSRFAIIMFLEAPSEGTLDVTVHQ
jgi:hypothetical protein